MIGLISLCIVMLFIASLPNINILSFTDNTNNCDVAIKLLMEIKNLSMQKNGLCIISIVINLNYILIM